MGHMIHKMIHDRRGQQILEYVLIASVVGAAMVAMSTYVFRSVQATQQMIETESRAE
jgi:Flp pilus assembly pilin Flp